MFSCECKEDVSSGTLVKCSDFTLDMDSLADPGGRRRQAPPTPKGRDSFVSTTRWGPPREILDPPLGLSPAVFVSTVLKMDHLRYACTFMTIQHI